MCFEDLHPEVREVIEQSPDEPSIRQISPQSARRRSERDLSESGVLDDPRPVGQVSEFAISGPAGEIPLRVYQPNTTGPDPVLIWFHGGGWVVGSLDAADPACRYITDHTNSVVVSVEYRLAPEHPFPEPLNDGYRVLEWVSGNASAIHGDDNRIGVGGVSAGANLAAAVTLLNRNRSGPELSVQVLGVPPTDSSCSSPSYVERADGSDLTRADMEYLWDCYLSSDIVARNPYASPIRERDLTGLPPTIVVTSEYDPLRDDGKRYAERITEAGGDVIHHHYEDASHGVLDGSALVAGISPTERAFDDLTQSIRDVTGT